MRFRVHEGGGVRDLDVSVREVIVAGMTGRDEEAVRHHISELAELGVEPPSTIPIYYRVSASLLTRDQRVQVVGSDTSGEVEAVLLGTEEGMLVAVGSDHTDRKAEADSIAISKQLCPKPISVDAWRYTDVAAQWDGIELVSDSVRAGRWAPYQRGNLGQIRRPEDLIGEFFPGLTELPAGVAMFTGTIPAQGQIAGSDQFSMALVDRKTRRTLWHAYDTVVLPLIA